MNNDLGDWLRKDIWDVRAAAALLLGFIPVQEGNGAITANLPPYRPADPNSRDWNAEMQAICVLAYEAIDAGVLPHLDKRKERRVEPAAFARWAMARGYRIPEAWQAILLFGEPEPSLLMASPVVAIAPRQSIPTQPPPKKKPVLEVRQEAIKCILQHLKELDPQLVPSDDRGGMPGQKSDFQRMCKVLSPKLFVKGEETFEKAIKGLAKFAQGARPTSYYSEHLATMRKRLPTGWDDSLLL